ncbi:hypothetical protein ACVIRO_001228 [Rhizobium ruizarguesonis]
MVARRAPCLIDEVPVRQAVPGSRRNLRQRDGARIDACGKIEPVFRPAAEDGGSGGDAAAMGGSVRSYGGSGQIDQMHVGARHLLAPQPGHAEIGSERVLYLKQPLALAL